MSRIPPAVVNAVYRRAGGDFTTLHGNGAYCEACGFPTGTHATALHHRLPRSAGGLDTPENLMLVHGDLSWNCHNLSEYSIHQNGDRSYALGHLVRRGHDPARHPIVARRDLRTLRVAPFPEPACTCKESIA